MRVSAQGKLLASYAHNAFGHRIARRARQADTDYFYLDNRLVAEQQHPSSTHSTARAGQAHRVFSPTRRYIYAQHVLVGVIDYTEPTLSWVNSDLIGRSAERRVGNECARPCRSRG